MAIVTVMASSRSFRNQCGYRMQGTRSRVASLLAPFIGTVAEMFASLLRRFGPSLARCICPHNAPSCDSCSRWPGSALCGPHHWHWSYWHRWLRWNQSLFEPARGDVSSFSPSEFSGRRSRHSRTARNVGARSVGACSGRSLFGGLISRIPSRRGLGLGLLGGIVSRIPSGWSLGLSHGSVGGTVTSWATLIHLSKDGRGLEAGFRFRVNRFFD